jgi:serine O-acetyltransferase
MPIAKGSLKVERIREYVRADIGRVTNGETGFLRKLGRLLLDPGVHAVLLYRLRRWLSLHHMGPIALVLGYFSSALTGAQISARATIGKGFAICHPHGIVIGGSAVIGEHCTLVQGNVIGQLYWSEDRPTIGDYFYAGAGAKILGRIRIGDRVQVGANAVVTTSVPDGVIVAAVPSRIIPGTGNGEQPRAGAGVQPRQEPVGQQPDSASDGGKAILQRVRSVLATLDGGRATDTINEGTTLLEEGVGLTSIEYLAFICAIEEEFGLTIDEGDVEVSKLATVGSLVTFIGKAIRA